MIKLDIQMFGGRGASSSSNINVKITNRTKQWTKKARDEYNNPTGYRLSDNVEIRKELSNRLDITSFDNALYVNNKYIMSNTGGYTMSYLKELGGIYQDALDGGIKDPYVSYNQYKGTIYIRDRKTGKEYNFRR